jgi:hypothetical protein
MLYVDALRDALDSARDAISEPRVFDNDAVRTTELALKSACADASHPDIVENTSVARAWVSLADAMTVMLFARAEACDAEGSFFRMLSAHRVVYRTGKELANALGAFNEAIRDAWIATRGFDPRHDATFRKAPLSASGISRDEK